MTHEQLSPPASAGDEVRRVANWRIGRVGVTASVLLGLSVVSAVWATWSHWNRDNLAFDLLYRRRIDPDRLAAADELTRTASVVEAVSLVITGAVFVFWLGRARRNAELLCPASHRRSRGWVIFGWICPIVSFWFPCVIVNDIYKASNPDNPPDLGDLATLRGSGRVGLWWALYLVGGFAGWAGVVGATNLHTESAFRSVALLFTAHAIALAGAAVVLTMIIRRVGGWQDAKVINAG